MRQSHLYIFLAVGVGAEIESYTLGNAFEHARSVDFETKLYCLLNP